ncbi:helix-turn-helix domain-containing protein [Rhodohalobacter barkolensis]|uniref:AraC family transcriptional regulator n=1 Tax=Rhodohalobacter barkolensis TaxID=2053187 RepID=A0A2N0VL34_9BACT|nr:AraC family transcriptional regulator [Rhodohalobacter barkolensis]PKD44851.1 AraC family transcriptional regulator [Rhodohalobacter barkolensis]
MDLYELQLSNPELFPQFSLKDTLVLYYNCPQRDKIMQLYSKHIQIHFTLSGKRIQKHGNHRWVFSPKKGGLLKKCAFLQELPADYSGWETMVFYLKDDYLRSVFEEFRPYLSMSGLPEPNKVMTEMFEIDEQIRSCYKSFLPYFGNTKPLPETLLESKFKELLFNIFSHPDNKHILAYILKIVDRYQTPVWEVMEENFMFDLKIQDYANIANRSLSTFKRDFKKHYQTTPGKWLVNRRLQKAKAFLETTDKPISDVAYECGFKNRSHFSRVFKKKFNSSPSHFQKHSTN